jgi:membrane-associated protein
MNFLDPNIIIPALGIGGIALIIFAETGLLFGFFFPGDTLLFVAGLFAHDGYFSILLLIIVASLSAIVGDSVGYYTGKKISERFIKNKESIGISKENLARSEKFYERFGSFTIVIARFVPVVRTVAPFLAGVSFMNYSRFISFNIAGGILWVTSVSLLGYYLGSKIPNIDQYIFPILLGIIVFSIIPAIWKVVFKKKNTY